MVEIAEAAAEGSARVICVTAPTAIALRRRPCRGPTTDLMALGILMYVRVRPFEKTLVILSGRVRRTCACISQTTLLASVATVIPGKSPCCMTAVAAGVTDTPPTESDKRVSVCRTARLRNSAAVLHAGQTVSRPDGGRRPCTPRFSGTYRKGMHTGPDKDDVAASVLTRGCRREWHCAPRRLRAGGRYAE